MYYLVAGVNICLYFLRCLRERFSIFDNLGKVFVQRETLTTQMLQKMSHCSYVSKKVEESLCFQQTFGHQYLNCGKILFKFQTYQKCHKYFKKLDKIIPFHNGKHFGPKRAPGPG